jgi:hypothetical protein
MRSLKQERKLVSETVILIDHENIAAFDPDAIPDDATVLLFLGAGQGSFKKDWVSKALRLPGRIKPVDIEGTGKNALDFHIAFYLGELLAKSRKASCVILSKDKGFAPLVKHLTARGFDVRQVDTLASLSQPTGKVASPEDVYLHVVKSLRKQEARARPASRTKLEKHVANMLKGKKADQDADKMVRRLEKDGFVRESGKELIYSGLDAER